MSLQAEISLSFNRSRIGTTERVLVDDIAGGRLVCRSQYESPEVDGEILVKTKEADEKLIGSYMNVSIVDADDYDLLAEAN